MPVFNPPLKFFHAAVQSVLDQIYPDWELCIADDASTDPQVRNLISELARTDARIARDLPNAKWPHLGGKQFRPGPGRRRVWCTAPFSIRTIC